VKRLVSRVLGWYFRFLADQLAALGQGMARLGLAAARRVERMEAEQAATRAELESLGARLARLEAAAGSEPEAEPASRP
jgi:BMFP domain-containing protein YqiC